MNQENEVKNKNLPTPEEQAKIFSAKTKRAQIRLVNRIAYFLIVALILAGIFYAVVKIFFSVDTIIVNGSSVYSYTEVTDACGYSKDDVLFAVSKSKVQKNILGKLPFVYSVEVKKEYPNTLIINIEDEKESFYFEYENKFFVLTSELKVLAVVEDENKLFDTYKKLAFVKLDSVKQVITTKEVQFFDQESYRRSAKVMNAILNSEMYGKLTYADIRDLYDVRFMYDNRIEIVFGSHIDIEQKISHALSVISKYGENAKGKIYVYDLDEAYAMIEDD
ncbi:MAG: FtsQ-type POTRA domain-containing protein [Ruminococcaceae bacterium]|nr:FtsQ-type POTRA domain-containing protein [Oscillospiraceae bacterium]